jgi:hypothetical protein
MFFSFFNPQISQITPVTIHLLPIFHYSTTPSLHRLSDGQNHPWGEIKAWSSGNLYSCLISAFMQDFNNLVEGVENYNSTVGKTNTFITN